MNNKKNINLQANIDLFFKKFYINEYTENLIIITFLIVLSCISILVFEHIGMKKTSFIVFEMINTFFSILEFYLWWEIYKEVKKQRFKRFVKSTSILLGIIINYILLVFIFIPINPFLPISKVKLNLSISILIAEIYVFFLFIIIPLFAIIKIIPFSYKYNNLSFFEDMLSTDKVGQIIVAVYSYQKNVLKYIDFKYVPKFEFKDLIIRYLKYMKNYYPMSYYQLKTNIELEINSSNKFISNSILPVITIVINLISQHYFDDLSKIESKLNYSILNTFFSKLFRSLNEHKSYFELATGILIIIYVLHTIHYFRKRKREKYGYQLALKLFNISEQ